MADFFKDAEDYQDHFDVHYFSGFFEDEDEDEDEDDEFEGVLGVKVRWGVL